MCVALTIGLVILSGICGRLGGAHGYNTKWRDFGCPTCFVLVLCLWFGWHPVEYALTWLLSFGSLTTYWDELFGYDCFWFSGLVAGIAAVPLLWADPIFWWIVPVRAAVLMVGWECLNRYLPQRIWIWQRDVVEENLRYELFI